MGTQSSILQLLPRGHFPWQTRLPPSTTLGNESSWKEFCLVFGPWKQTCWLSHSFLLGTKVVGRSISAGLLLDSINFYKGEASRREVFRLPSLVVIAWAGNLNQYWETCCLATTCYILLCSFITSRDNFLSGYTGSFALFFDRFRIWLRKRKILFIGPFITSVISFCDSAMSWRIGSPGYPSYLCCSSQSGMSELLLMEFCPLTFLIFNCFSSQFRKLEILMSILFTYLFFPSCFSRDGSSGRN